MTEKRHCYVLENDGTVRRRPCVVARGMIARSEAAKMVTNVTLGEAMAVLKGGRKLDDVLRARDPGPEKRAK